MRKVIIMGIPVRFHPLMPLMMALMVYLGGARLAVAGMVSLAVHEMAHVLAARMLGLRVNEMELMPFGGAARIDEIESLRPGQLLTVVLAGPASNLMLAAVFAALGWAKWLDHRMAVQMVNVNIALFLFNLLPALPLDGGRLFSGLLGQQIGNLRAINIAIWIGRVVAILLLATAVAGYVFAGSINLTLPLSAVFLLASGKRERENTSGAALMSMLNRQAELANETALPLTWIAVSKDTDIRNVARLLRARRVHMLAVYDADMRYIGNLDEKQLFAGLMKDDRQQIGQLLTHPVKKSAGFA